MGRMGHQVAAAVEAAGAFVVCGVDAAYQGQPWAYPLVEDYAHISQEADVLIDFSRPGGLNSLLAYCQAHHLPAVLCATGYNQAQQEQIEQAARTIPLLRSANMSLGVHVLEQLVTMAGQALGDSYDIEIVETHHRMKADAPSGTALMLSRAAQEGRDQALNPVYGRHGPDEKRQREDIGIHAVRGGTVVGEHQVGFYGEGEQLLLTHRAESRALFAQGALRAAAFLQGKPAGLYTMRHLVVEMLGVKP